MSRSGAHMGLTIETASCSTNKKLKTGNFHFPMIGPTDLLTTQIHTASALSGVQSIRQLLYPIKTFIIPAITLTGLCNPDSAIEDTVCDSPFNWAAAAIADK